MNKVLLIIAAILVCVGLFRPKVSNIIINPNKSEQTVCSSFIVTPPMDKNLKTKAEAVIEALATSSDRKTDGVKLASLYHDIATLIELDAENQVVKTTDDVRQANSLAGLMLKLNIKGKYPSLPQAANEVILTAIGQDNVLLNGNLRTKAADGFKALSWACNEGSK